MPFETTIIEAARNRQGSSRTHKDVAEEITSVFNKIAENGGKFVTAISLADESLAPQEFGHPSGATYIVAEYPEK